MIFSLEFQRAISMKKLISLTTLTLLSIYSVPAAFAEGVPGETSFSHLFHSNAHPNDARALSAMHHFKLHVQGSDLSQISIDLPEGVKIRRGVEVTDQSGKKLDADVSINDKKATVAFSRPVSPETILTVSMKGVQTPFPGYRKTWRYSVRGKNQNMKEDLLFGTAQIQTYE